MVDLAARAADDEIRHVGLCEGLVEHFGLAPPARDRGHAPPVGPSGTTHRERVLYEVVAMSCVTETVSAAALAAMQDAARDPKVRDTVHSILRDEVQHSRLGWAHLAAEKNRGPLAFISDYLPAMLAETVATELFSDVEEDPVLKKALGECGALSRSDRRNLFVDAMQKIVFPGLEHFGVDTAAGSRWLDEQLAPSFARRDE